MRATAKYAVNGLFGNGRNSTMRGFHAICVKLTHATWRTILFICWIEIQAKNVFFRVFASAIGESFVFSDDFKTAFLQHSYRPDVVRCCLGENRPIYNKVEHPIERLSR